MRPTKQPHEEAREGADRERNADVAEQVCRGHQADREDRAHGEVDAADDDHERRPSRHDPDLGDLAQDVDDVARGQEVGRQGTTARCRRGSARPTALGRGAIWNAAVRSRHLLGVRRSALGPATARARPPTCRRWPGCPTWSPLPFLERYPTAPGSAADRQRHDLLRGRILPREDPALPPLGHHQHPVGEAQDLLHLGGRRRSPRRRSRLRSPDDLVDRHLGADHRRRASARRR